MQQGIVKWFNDKKGFGFINSENKDYFVHFSEIQDKGFKSLKVGQNVLFVSSKNEKGFTATKVMINEFTQELN